jgi:hypothetical protein
MSQSFDLSQFPDLPPEVVKAFVAQSAALEVARFEASVERAARQHEQAVVAEKEAFITELKELIEKLEGQALEDLETAIAETQAQIAMAKHSEHMPLNRQAVAMARLGVPIERSVLADWMGRTGALIAPVVDRMAVLLKTGSSRLYVPSRALLRIALPGNGRNHGSGA